MKNRRLMYRGLMAAATAVAMWTPQPVHADDDLCGTNCNCWEAKCSTRCGGEEHITHFQCGGNPFEYDCQCDDEGGGGS